MHDVSLVSGYPARINDYLILKSDDAPCVISQLYLIFARVISVTFFPICVLGDLILYSGDFIIEWIQTKCASTKQRCQEHEKKMYHTIDVIKRCALGIIFFLAGLIYPDVITEHFLRHDRFDGWIRHYGQLHKALGSVKYPKTEEDLQAILKSGKKIAIVGAGMSQGKQALPIGFDNILIDMKHFNHVVLSKESKTAIVGGGATWQDVQNSANQEGLAVQVMQASNIFSIGGSISINCHGWDHRAGPLGNTILSLKIIDPEGNIKKLTKEDELFHYVIGGLGGFGIILEAEIALVDNDLLSEEGKEVKPVDYPAYFANEVENVDAIKMHLYRLSLDPSHLFETGVAVNYRKVGEKKAGEPLIEEAPNGKRIERIKLHLARRFKILRKIGWKIEKKNALQAHIQYRNQLMRPPINPIFNCSHAFSEWLQEYFVSRKELPAFLTFMKGILEKNHVHLLNASIRFVKKDDISRMPYAGEDRFALVLFFNQSLAEKEVAKTKKWIREVNDYLTEHQGAFYLPYMQFAKKKQLERCYPTWKRVKEAKDRFDPEGRLMNGFYEKYLKKA